MSHSQELLSSINQAAIARMSPYELVDRGVALRTELGHNSLDIEPIEVEGGTLYTVTSGIVAERALYVDTAVEADEIVRRQQTPRPLTLFADVVELRPPDDQRDGDARLYRVQQPLEPTLAEMRAPFRPTILEAMQPGNDGYPVTLHYSDKSSDYTTYRTRDPYETPTETRVMTASGFGMTPLLASPETQIDMNPGKTSEIDEEVAVRPSFSGPVRATLEPQHIVRITNTGVLAGPASEQVVDLTIPQGTSQYLRRNEVVKFERVPDDATFAPNEKGVLVMSSDRADQEKYKGVDLKPYINDKTLARLLPEEAVDWSDVTQLFLKDLAKRLATLLPLDGTVSWEQTVAKARDEVREALLTNRKPVLGGIGCLAVAARMAELPAHPDGNFLVDLSFFQKAT